MMSENNIERKIDDTLLSIEGIQRATPAPFFFTRLQARLQTSVTVWEKITLLINRPAVAFATISFVLVINAFAFLWQQSQAVEQSAIPSAAADFGDQNINNVYDFAAKTNNTLLKIWNEDAKQTKK